MTSREFIRRLHEKYGTQAAPREDTHPTSDIELIENKGPERRMSDDPSIGGVCADGRGDLLDYFLADAQIPCAVMHSHALNRDFILARDAAALDSLTEADRALPVLYFADCDRLAGLDARDLAVILDTREALGPSVVLVAVRPRAT